MLSSTLRFLCHDLLSVRSRFSHMLVALAAQRRCAQRVDRLSERLLEVRHKMDALRRCMDTEVATEVIDTDLSLHAALLAVKNDIRDTRYQVSCLYGATLPARLQRSLYRLNQIAGDTCAVADKLQGDIGSHDQACLR